MWPEHHLDPLIVARLCAWLLDFTLIAVAAGFEVPVNTYTLGAAWPRETLLSVRVEFGHAKLGYTTYMAVISAPLQLHLAVYQKVIARPRFLVGRYARVLVHGGRLQIFARVCAHRVLMRLVN